MKIIVILQVRFFITKHQWLCSSDNPPYHMDMEGMMEGYSTERHKVWLDDPRSFIAFRQFKFSSDELRDYSTEKMLNTFDYYQSF